MIQDQTVKQLMSISKPITFSQNCYITIEGLPGNEMYIILKGSVGVYVTSALGTLTEVSRIMAGDFFGEMSIFDNLPRSASCIALEDTICISVSKDNLNAFFKNCPEMAARVMENMSGRIRRLDNQLYKTEHFVQNLNPPKFRLPEEYSFSHIVEEPAHDLEFINSAEEICPVCGKEIIIHTPRKNILRQRKIDADRRVHYVECDPIWFEVLSCPYCHYSNHVLSFFRMIPFKREFIKKILKQEHDPVLEQVKFLSTPFDHLVLKYLQAIHINEAVNAADDMLIGMLLTDLYWLANDSCDKNFSEYCAKKAAEKLKKAVDAMKPGEEQYSLSLTLASILSDIGNTIEAKKYCEIAAQSSLSEIKTNAYRICDKQ